VLLHIHYKFFVSRKRPRSTKLTEGYITFGVADFIADTGTSESKGIIHDELLKRGEVNKTVTFRDKQMLHANKVGKPRVLYYKAFASLLFK